MPDTWLRPGRSDRSCTDTGTMATSEESGSSPQSIRNWRSTPGHQGHHHVVDLDAEVVLDRLDVLEVQLGEGDVAMGGDAGVERVCGAANGAAIARPRGPAHRVDHGRHRGGQHAGGQGQRPGGESAQTAEGDPQRVGVAAAGHRLRRGGVGLSGAQLRHQVGAGDTVDRGVVHLGQHRQPAALAGVGARNALDHPHLPQRVAAIQRQGGQVPADLAELDPAAGGGQADAVQVAVDLEVPSSTHTGWSRLRKLFASSPEVGNRLIRWASESRSRSKV